MWRRWIWCALTLCGCNTDALSQQVGYLTITPQPTSTQQILTDPTGLSVGQIPLFSVESARFELKNEGTGRLTIEDISLDTQTQSNVTWELVQDDTRIVTPPVIIEARASLILTVALRATADAQPALAQLLIKRDQSPLITTNASIPIRVEGEGKLIGEPLLEVVYDGVVHPQAGTCTTSPGNGVACRLDPLQFGNVPVGAPATETITLRNVPLAGTCALPDTAENIPDCRPICSVSFDRDSTQHNVGIGILPQDSAYSLAGNHAVPFSLAPTNPRCPTSDVAMMRGDVRLLVQLAPQDHEQDHVDGLLVLESNAPNAPIIEIPLQAAIRTAPVAVAQLHTCDQNTPATSTAHSVPDTTNCSDPNNIRPLGRVFLDGTRSYDPARPTDPTAIVQYRWELISWPAGTDTALMDLRGSNTSLFSAWLPLAGQYVARLHVTNDQGIESGISSTSDVTFTALPDSRVHIQLVWDNPTNDQDLHVVYAGTGDVVYGSQSDCFWKNCRPSTCTRANACTPVRWFTDVAAYEGPNPRLDIDDTHGLGPENVNISEPRAGQYRVYAYYYGLVDPADDPTQVTVRIYVDAVLRAEYRRTLRRDDLWAVAQITWEDGRTAQVNTAQSDSAGAIGSVHKLHYSPYPEGIYFGPVFR